MKFDVSFKNNEIIIGEFNTRLWYIRDKIARQMASSLLTIEMDAKSNCPVDLGSLKQSITTEIFTDKIGGRVVCMENLDPPIGAYIEFGTGQFVEIPPGLEEYAMTFYKNGKGRIAAHPFLFPAFDVEGEKLMDRLTNFL